MHRVLYGRYFREWDIRKTKSVRAMTRNILKKAQQKKRSPFLLIKGKYAVGISQRVYSVDPFLHANFTVPLTK